MHAGNNQQRTSAWKRQCVIVCRKCADQGMEKTFTTWSCRHVAMGSCACLHPAPSPRVLSGESMLSNSVFCLFSVKMAEMRFSYKCALCF